MIADNSSAELVDIYITKVVEIFNFFHDKELLLSYISSKELMYPSAL